jgi:hypothetical protein
VKRRFVIAWLTLKMPASMTQSPLHRRSGTRKPLFGPLMRHVSIEEALHFAACCKRIGKTATTMNRNMSLSGDKVNDIDEHSDPLVIQAWKCLATCDGLVGAPLGASVKPLLGSVQRSFVVGRLL